jgi:lipopolysaccharide export system permease protein
MRLEEIARFASSNSSFGTVLLFIFYQIPYILPLAIPISALLAAYLLSDRMSTTQEYTSLRAAGITLKRIMHPLLLSSVLLSFSSLLISTEIGPYMRAQAKALIFQVIAQNPLVLLQKDAVLKFRNAFLDMDSSSRFDKAVDVLFVARNGSTGRLNMMIAKELSMVGSDLHGKQISFLSSIDPKIEDNFDHLVVENQHEMTTAASGLSRFWDDARWRLDEDYLPLRLLLAKNSVEYGSPFGGSPVAMMEFARRSSLAIATISFTFMGLVFGMHTRRGGRRHAPLFIAILFAAIFFASLMAAKSLKEAPKIASSLYFMPHVLIFMGSITQLRRIERGALQ